MVENMEEEAAIGTGTGTGPGPAEVIFRGCSLVMVGLDRVEKSFGFEAGLAVDVLVVEVEGEEAEERIELLHGRAWKCMEGSATSRRNDMIR